MCDKSLLQSFLISCISAHACVCNYIRLFERAGNDTCFLHVLAMTRVCSLAYNFPDLCFYDFPNLEIDHHLL
jgi:hypothetical protein